MSVIKNLHKLTAILDEAALAKLEAGAGLHRRMSNIEFKVTSVAGNTVVLRVTQGKHLSGNYADAKTLTERAKELFSPFLPGYTIHAGPVPYIEALPSAVTPEWINERMLKYGVKIKDMVAETGIPKSSFSNWLAGAKPMTQHVKVMFYYYFKLKQYGKDFKPIPIYNNI